MNATLLIMTSKYVMFMSREIIFLSFLGNVAVSQ